MENSVNTEKSASETTSESTSRSSPAKDNRRTFRRKMIGVVKSDKMDKTIVVEVIRRYLNSQYKKYVRTRRRFFAHDENNECRIGDSVEIQEHRPISKNKRWIVVRTVTKSTNLEQ